MNLHVVEQGETGLARIVSLKDHAVLATVSEVNILVDDLPPLDAVAADRLVCWSGSLGADLWSRSPLNFLAPGQRALRARCEALRQTLEMSGTRLCLRPHARHVLSDAPSTLAFARDLGAGPFEVGFAPADLLERSMLERAAEHLERMFAALGPTAAMVFLHDVRPEDDRADEGPWSAVPLGRGVLPRDVVVGLIAEYVPPATPIVLLPGDAGEQQAWLGAGY